jgi:hypothetical protein
MYRLKDLKTPQDFNYTEELKALLKLLKDTWDIKAAPKGYAKFMKDYTDYQGMEELPEDELIKNFGGCGDGSISSASLPIRLTKEHVGYEDRNQVNDGPLEVLIGVLLTHGLVIGQRMGEINRETEPYRRIADISYAFTMSDGDDYKPDTVGDCEVEFQHIYRREFHALLNTSDERSLKEIRKAFDDERREVAWKYFVQHLNKYLDKLPTFIAYSSSGNKDLHAIWGYLHKQTGSKERFEATVERLKALDIELERDNVAFILRLKEIPNG